MMEFSGTQELSVSPDVAWAYFTDTDVLAECGPGVKEMNLKSPSDIEAVLAVGVGSVKPTFNVDVVVTEADDPSRLRMKATGDATRNAFEAVAEMDLIENGDGTSSVEWTATASVSGLIASLGKRALGSVTDRLVNDFFDDLEETIEAGEGATSELEAAENEKAELDA